MSSSGTTWLKRNVQVLTIFGPLLIIAGLVGFLLPPHLSLMSGAAPYNVFHLVAGAIAVLLVLRGRHGAITGFNLVFGIIDLWQSFAGVTGLFPAKLFALRPADHVVHLVVGAFLAALGYLGSRRGESEAR